MIAGSYHAAHLYSHETSIAPPNSVADPAAPAPTAAPEQQQQGISVAIESQAT